MGLVVLRSHRAAGYPSEHGLLGLRPLIIGKEYTCMQECVLLYSKVLNRHVGPVIKTKTKSYKTDQVYVLFKVWLMINRLRLKI